MLGMVTWTCIVDGCMGHEALAQVIDSCDVGGMFLPREVGHHTSTLHSRARHNLGSVGLNFPPRELMRYNPIRTI
jgi:hypothetical protein